MIRSKKREFGDLANSVILFSISKVIRRKNKSPLKLQLMKKTFKVLNKLKQPAAKLGC